MTESGLVTSGQDSMRVIRVTSPHTQLAQQLIIETMLMKGLTTLLSALEYIISIMFDC